MPLLTPLLPALAALLTGMTAAQPTSQPTDQQPTDQQPITPTQPNTQTVTIAQLFEQVDRTEPVRRAGLRADLIRRTQQTVPVVVIVSDARAFLEAVAGWEGGRRFPILWDDGSLRSTEDIARFVRGFEPDKVLRYAHTENAPAWPSARDDRQAAFKAALTRATSEGAPDFETVLAVLRQGGVVSPGIVLTDVDDNAWPAALALAAARYQPVGFMQSPSGPNAALTTGQADLIEQAAQELAQSTGLEWRTIGDDIDALTLCLNTGTRIKHGEGPRDFYATTARVGRLGADGSGVVWANSGQIIGSSSQALYRAMSALFLTPDDAFIFDAYDSTQPWVTYSGAEASGHLRTMGLTTQLHNQPANTTGHWLSLTARPIRASMILINSSGGQSNLTLPGGQIHGSNIPILNKPAIAHVVHSFSLQTPTNRNTVGGALLDRGVYALLGSVDEPFLQAFVPTPMVVRRLGAGLNFAAAVRIDDAPVWKLTVLGDPLITMGPPGTRLETDDTGLPGQLTDLKSQLTEVLAERDLAAGARILTLLGRDTDAARLAAAAMDDKTTPLDPAVAAAAIPALFRAGRHGEVVTAYGSLTSEYRDEPILADCFWFAGRFLLASSADREQAEGLMRIYPRQGSRVGDAEELAMRFRGRSLSDAILVLEALRPKITADWERRALDAALDRVRDAGG
jgi:hypothetical protein